jgi:beta-lactamase regulating signal transducer with metallopeptidase domain
VETLLRAGLGNAVAATLLALLVAGLGGFFRRAPALRHVLWLLVLLKLVTPPLAGVPVAWPVVPPAVEPPLDQSPEIDEGWLEAAAAFEAVDVIEAKVAAVDPVPVPVPASWTWPQALAAVWLGGSAVSFVLASVRVRRFCRALRLARPVSDEASGQVEELADRLGLARAPRLWCVPGAVSPMLWSAGGSPRLIVPEALWASLDDDQRATLLTHELAHLRRGDHWVRGLELLVTGVFWWLPTVWLARLALREAEEQCCDAWVVWALPDAARTYAETLLQTVEFLSGAGSAVPVAASGLGHLHQLKRRLIMIMQGTTSRTLGWTGALLVLSLSAALLPLSPTWAQRPDSGRAEDRVVSSDQDDTDRAAAEKKRAEDRLDWSNRMLEKGYLSKAQNNADRAVLEKYYSALKLAQGKATSDEADGKKATFDPAAETINQLKERLRVLQDGEAGEAAKTIDKLQKRLRVLRDGEDGKDGASRQEEAKKIVQSLNELVRALAQEKRAGDIKEETSGEKEEAEKARADMEKARAEIKELAAKVQEKHREFQEAELALQRAIGRLNKTANLRGALENRRVFEFRVTPPVPPREVRVNPSPQPAPRPRTGPSQNQDARIEALEKRLDQLLDEVKSLKKEKQEGTGPSKEKAEKGKIPQPLAGYLTR